VSHRILFTIESLFPLGSAQQLKLLADSLVQQGHEIHVAVLGEYAFEPDQWTQAGVNVCFLNADDKTPLHTARDGFYVVKELRKLIQDVSPTIVHSWCGRAELLTLLATEEFPLARSFLKPLKRFRLLSTELFLQPEKRFTRQAVENRMSKRVESMIVPHESVKKHLVEDGYREPRITIVPNALSLPDPPIDHSEARKSVLARLDLPETTYLAGAVAPLIHRSRLKDLIWATDLLTCIREDFHFVIIGTGSQLRRLKRFAALTEAKSHVHFLGQPESAETIVAGLDFYWHSHLLDPLPGNLLAAMADGIPVISVYGEGTREIIRHQETGFAVNFGARDEFARWTKFLIERPEPAQKLARQGQEFVRQHFDVATMVNGYLEIYDLAN
jgi:glycosyltransferase involved in cell wall biosynthesis